MRRRFKKVTRLFQDFFKWNHAWSKRQLSSGLGRGRWQASHTNFTTNKRQTLHHGSIMSPWSMTGFRPPLIICSVHQRNKRLDSVSMEPTSPFLSSPQLSSFLLVCEQANHLCPTTSLKIGRQWRCLDSLNDLLVESGRWDKVTKTKAWCLVFADKVFAGNWGESDASNRNRFPWGYGLDIKTLGNGWLLATGKHTALLQGDLEGEKSGAMSTCWSWWPGWFE